MGLGPMACSGCLVYADLVIEKRQEGYGPKEWVCPSCGNDHSLDYLWMFTEAEQASITANSKLIRFVQGQV
jgi:hypothetical protein